MRFYDGLNFKKNKNIGMEKVAGEQGLALQQYFYTNRLIFLKFKPS